MPNKETEILLKNIQDCLREYSVNELNDALLMALDNKCERKKDVDLIIKLVCQEFKTTDRILLRSKLRRDIQDARFTAFCLLHFVLKFPIRYIASRIFQFRSHTSVSVSIRYFKNLNEKIKTDYEFKQRFDKVKNEYLSLINEETK